MSKLKWYHINLLVDQSAMSWSIRLDTRIDQDMADCEFIIEIFYNTILAPQSYKY